MVSVMQDENTTITDATKWVYLFNEVDQAQENLGGDWEAVRSLLGGKGANLGDMTRIGVPVPHGLTLQHLLRNRGLPRRLMGASTRRDDRR